MIRRASIDDALDIYNLQMTLFENPYSLDTIKSDLNNSKIAIFVYEKNSKIIAFISIYYFLDEANLQQIAVISSERNKGIASSLINYASNFLVQNKVKSFYLEVNEKNDVAIKVYEKLGFKVISTRQNYYGDNSAIIYQKNLL